MVLPPKSHHVLVLEGYPRRWNGRLVRALIASWCRRLVLSAGLLGLAFGQALWRTRDDPFVEGFGCALMWAGLLLLILAVAASATMHLVWVG